MDAKKAVLAEVRDVLRRSAEAKFLLTNDAPLVAARHALRDLLDAVEHLREVWVKVNGLEPRPAWDWPEWGPRATTPESEAV